MLQPSGHCMNEDKSLHILVRIEAGLYVYITLQSSELEVNVKEIECCESVIGVERELTII